MEVEDCERLQFFGWRPELDALIKKASVYNKVFMGQAQ